MRKKHLPDGLLQIAILLSLLRTDLDEYLNILAGYHSHEYELSDILLGSTSAITQTHSYHNNGYRDLGGYIHPKNVENIISRSVFRDLHVLGRYNDIEAPTISAYLVPELESNLPLSSENANTNTAQQSPSDNNNNSPQSLSSGLQLTPSENQDESNLDSSAVIVGDELSQEDMDLIDILWRQDIDLGVGKEVFDINLRRELEKEQELELAKEQQKKEEKSEDEGETQLAEFTQALNMVVDGETGELVPAFEVPQPTEGRSDLTSEQGLSIEEAIEILQEHTAPPPSPSEPIPRQHSLSDELSGLILSLPEVSMSRQVSIEGRWNDVEDFISDQLEANSTLVNQNTEVAPDTAQFSQQATLLHNASFPMQNSQFTSQNTPFTSQYDASQTLPSNREALLQNASLGNSQQADATELLAAMDIGVLGSPTENDTQPLFNLNNTDTALFPNASITNSTNFLLDLLEENNAEDADMPFNPPDSLFAPIKSEEQLSDSAVGSLSSAGSLSPYSDSAASNMTSPFENTTLSFEHLEGATGGLEHFLTATKEAKTETAKYSFFSGSDSQSPEADFQYTDQANISDTNTTGTYTPALERHIGHNHTYPALPGQEPKERKCDVAARMRNKTSTDTRDEKKAKKLQLPFSVEDIIHSPVEKFNDMLTRYKLTEPQLQLMKDIRRRGKNKVAAQNCRKRKMEVIDTLEEEVEKMRHERDSLQRQKGLIDKERIKLREKYNAMYREVFNSLRDEHGQPYDPDEYTLQHTADGNVFLVPKNDTVESESFPKKDKKRKSQKK